MRASRILPKRERLVVGFIPLLEQVPGFIAYYWIDAGGGVMASLSVYENQAGADESVRLAGEWVRDNAATLITIPQSRGRSRSFQDEAPERTPRQSRSRHPGAFFRLIFTEPVTGPLAFGFACHLGLGLFRHNDPGEV